MNTNKLDPELNEYLFEILDQAKNGISITDPNQDDNPLIYINQTFTKLFEYEYDDAVGRNCRFLQAEDREQEGIQKIRDAVKNEVAVTVVLRNYSKTGKLLYNEVTVSPILDKDTKKVKYFLGVQKDVTKEQTLMRQLRDLV